MIFLGHKCGIDSQFKCSLHIYSDSHMDPEFENMSTDVRERRGVNTSQLQVLLNHPPARRLLTTEQSRIEQVPLCVGKNSHLLQNHRMKLSVPAVIMPSTPVRSRHRSTSLRNCMLPFANTGMLTLRLYKSLYFYSKNWGYLAAD